MGRTAVVIVALAAFAALVLAAACGGSGGNADEKAIEETIRAVFVAQSEKDIPTVITHVTDAYLSDLFSFQTTREEEQRAYEQGLYLTVPPIEPEDFRDFEIAGGTASVSLTLRQAQGVQRWLVSLVKEDGAWLLDGLTVLHQDTPDGATEVQVEMVDHEYRLSADTVPAGDVAFQATNDGTKPHNLFLIKLPDGVSVHDGFSVRQPEDVGATYAALYTAIERGERGTWIVEDLEPGRYGYYCWVPEAGNPHAFLGMAGELTVE